VSRALFVAALLCLSFELSGLGASFGDLACENEDCPADASGGECAPNCHSCACCSFPRVTPSSAFATAPTPDTVRIESIGRADMPAAPAPADILHVPKQLLA
jgi:hypothetical protein